MDAEGVVVGIVARSADDRIISVTDPDMRHGRKSASALIAGFKAHLLVSVGWGAGPPTCKLKLGLAGTVALRLV